MMRAAPVRRVAASKGATTRSITWTASRRAGGRDDGPHRRSPPPPYAETMVSGASNSVLMRHANAGTGAVRNSGYRRRPGAEKARNAPDAATRGSSATPAAQFPERKTYSLPSSSFNASSWVSSGVRPPLGGKFPGPGSGHVGVRIQHKKTAMLMPGQGSQYVAMSKDLYEAFGTAREVWHSADESLGAFSSGRSPLHMHMDPQRAQFEEHLRRYVPLDHEHVTKSVSGDEHWLCNLVFHGDQLGLTRSENAQPAILTATVAFLSVLRREFGVDLLRDVEWAAGHGSGTYAALVAAGALDAHDAVRALRCRGLEAMRCVRDSPVLFPPGCEPPSVIYETWAFANAGSGLGSNLLVQDLPQASNAVSGGQSAAPSARPTWKRSQVSAVMVNAGKLQEALEEVALVADEIRAGRVTGLSADEFVGVANINSQLQIVLSGTRVGVSYACDRLRYRGLGARAVNLPVSGPYHTALMNSAADSFRHLVDVMPIREPDDALSLVSSVDGAVLHNVPEIRSDLRGALHLPVRWLDAVDTLVAQGVRRFVCLGPGRALAHLLSKELAYRERLRARNAQHQNKDSAALEPGLDFEVWSIATADDVRSRAEATDY